MATLPDDLDKKIAVLTLLTNQGHAHLELAKIYLDLNNKEKAVHHAGIAYSLGEYAALDIMKNLIGINATDCWEIFASYEATIFKKNQIITKLEKEKEELKKSSSCKSCVPSDEMTGIYFD
ncbi:MAG: hypothetical protein Hyperionvirus2_180 [Hyperionvirus sp.]|uniref:Uncharacterized protein n=1 Tax=Hyperionvirus sp. TaxID=2487770 RepID=A0A3G5A703_9VIRU|nr:MAG: hypothetical protein Hyperionvirus2_180 [Hyperionvirus sp.]